MGFVTKWLAEKYGWSLNKKQWLDLFLSLLFVVLLVYFANQARLDYYIAMEMYCNPANVCGGCWCPP